MQFRQSNSIISEVYCTILLINDTTVIWAIRNYFPADESSIVFLFSIHIACIEKFLHFIGTTFALHKRRVVLRQNCVSSLENKHDAETRSMSIDKNIYLSISHHAHRWCDLNQFVGVCKCWSDRFNSNIIFCRCYINEIKVCLWKVWCVCVCDCVQCTHASTLDL